MRDFSGRNFRGQDLRGESFVNTDIQGANFTNAELQGADFTGAIEHSVMLAELRLEGDRSCGCGK